MANKIPADNIRWVLDLDVKGVQAELHGLSSESQDLMIKNKELEAELKKVSKAMKEAETDLEKLRAKGDTTSATYQKAKVAFDQNAQAIVNINRQVDENNKKIDLNNDKAKQLTNTLKIEDMTMDQLKARAKDLAAQLNKTSEAASPEAYAALDKELKEVKERMGELKNGGEETASTFGGTGTRSMVTFAAAVAAVKVGIDIFEGIMMSNRGTAIEFTAAMDGLTASFNYFKTSVANWDFTNFWDGVKKAYTAGNEATKMFENVHNMQNSFKLTSAQEISEIEDLKTQLRDVNLTNEQRIRIGDEIIERTNKLAEQEKKLYEENLKATKRQLDAQSEFNEQELDFIIVNRNAQEENLENLGKIKDLEDELNHLRKNANTWENYSNDGKNNYYVNKLKETNEEIKQYEALIENRKNAYGFTYPEQYEIMSSAVEKFARTDKEAVDAYVEARVRVNDVNIKTKKELRETQNLVNSLTKKQTDRGLGGSTPEQRQMNALNKLNTDIEIKRQTELSKIKEDYKNKEIKTDSEFNRQVVANESAMYATRKAALESFLENPLEPKIRQEVLRQIAEIDNKILDQEIKVQKEIEKILLNADPVEKEKRAYEERLSAVGLYGKERETLTKDELDALELLEKQHKENLERIDREAETRKKAQSEKEFEESFQGRREQLQLEINELMQNSAAAGRTGYDAEMELHIKRLQMIQEEIEARRAAGLEVQKLTQQLGRVESQMTATIKKENDVRAANYNRYATSLASATEDFFSGQKSGLEAFGGSMIDILFDVLTQIINQKIIEATAVAVAEQAKAAAIAAAMPDSVFTFGASAAARTAAIGAIIMGALQVAKGALKGMLGKKKSSSSDSSSSRSQTTGNITLKQRAKGKYDVIGADDKRLYRNVPYTGDAKTGVVSRPTLMGERGSELVVSSPDFKALQKHINYPMILQALHDVRFGTPQRAEGKYDNVDTNFTIQNAPTMDPELLSRLAVVLEKMSNGVPALIGATEMQAALDNLRNENVRFTQKGVNS